MTRRETELLLERVDLHRNEMVSYFLGEDIEYLNIKGEWEFLPRPDWSKHDKYRVVKKRKEIWINLHSDGSFGNIAYDTKGKAFEGIGEQGTIKQVKFIENE